jgi:RHS repeat-associated protein
MGYDRYANLLTVSVTQCSAPSLSLSVNTKNQITNSGFSYDAAGDLTADGVYSYGWNAEAHLTSGNGVTYTYDGRLQRVEKSNGMLYWYCCKGRLLATSDLSGNIVSEWTYFNGQRVARRDVSSGNVYYIFSDRLRSYRTLTDNNGNVKGESDYYPFSGERVISSTVTDSLRFAGMEWDSEDGLNHTRYRQYTSAQGRWESPERKRGCVNFPQGQNLYAYVKDDPTDLIDLLGDDPISGEDPCGGVGWESNAGCSGPGGDPGGGGGGGGGSFGDGELPDCDPSCCNIETYDSQTCTDCAMNCAGEDGAGGYGWLGWPCPPDWSGCWAGFKGCLGQLGKGLNACTQACGNIFPKGSQQWQDCINGCATGAAGDLAVCTAYFVGCVIHSTFLTYCP